ncbi:MAG: DUF1499 domain-containing protein [Geminicoccaceae bacterium]|nr:DUF1499 domain-containing protein [Geminicoccaceae bacterium]
MADDPAPLDPLTLARTGRPNDALLCPKGEGCAAEPDGEVPWYPVDPAALLEAWRAVLEATPRVDLDRDAGGNRLAGAARSRVFGFVDRFAVRVVGDVGRSSYVAYSRALQGYYDFGVNKRRLEGWRGTVAARLPPPSP